MKKIIIFLHCLFSSCSKNSNCSKYIFSELDNSTSSRECINIDGIEYDKWHFISDSFNVSGYFGFDGDTLFIIPHEYVDSLKCVIRYPVALLRKSDENTHTVIGKQLTNGCEHVPLIPVTYTTETIDVSVAERDTIYSIQLVVYEHITGQPDLKTYKNCPIDYCDMKWSKMRGLIDIKYCRSKYGLGIPWLITDSQKFPKYY